MRSMIFKGILLGMMALLAACWEQEPAQMQAVIIEFRLDMAGEVPDEAALTAIAAGQQSLLDRLASAGFQPGNVKTYRMLPQLAAHLPGEAVMFLLRQDDVVAVRPDRINAIMEQ